MFNAIPDSVVDDVTYNSVFRNAWRLIAASMVAYLVAQFIDVRIFHFWKRLTNGKHLWLRNNASTIASQLVDTTLVICILFIGVWSSSQIFSAIIDGWLFKMLMAFIDTPIIYGIIHLLKGKVDISDLSNVEIIEGLNNKDTVYILPSKSLVDYQRQFRERVEASFSFG